MRRGQRYPFDTRRSALHTVLLPAGSGQGLPGVAVFRAPCPISISKICSIRVGVRAITEEVPTRDRRPAHTRGAVEP